MLPRLRIIASILKHNAGTLIEFIENKVIHFRQLTTTIRQNILSKNRIFIDYYLKCCSLEKRKEYISINTQRCFIAQWARERQETISFNLV